MSHLTIHNAVLLFAVAVIGGAINSVAGGGSFLCFPVLLFTGVPPIQANATNTMALWPGTLASVGAYRRELTGENSKLLIPLVCTGLIGGIIGALTLLHTSQATFLRLIPYLIGVATVLFAISGRLTRFLRARSSHLQNRSRFAIVAAALLQLVIAVYIGFFGAGAGILMLAMLALLGIESIHTMNAYKTVLATVGNGIAIAMFVIAGAILWPQAIVMLVGASVGGYGGAYYAQKMNPLHVRWMVIAIGVLLTVYFFWKQGF
ncbi:MAG TPA: sulfite exporter TauE/SafE family protein [Terriglobales bacterium]